MILILGEGIKNIQQYKCSKTFAEYKTNKIVFTTTPPRFLLQL